MEKITFPPHKYVLFKMDGETISVLKAYWKMDSWIRIKGDFKRVPMKENAEMYYTVIRSKAKNKDQVEI
jgi:hypothetical protein